MNSVRTTYRRANIEPTKAESKFISLSEIAELNCQVNKFPKKAPLSFVRPHFVGEACDCQNSVMKFEG